MTELGIIFIVLLVTVTTVSVPVCYLVVRLVESAVRNSHTIMRERDKERHDAMNFVSQFADKLIGEPEWIMQQHARDRRYSSALDTSLDRAELRESRNGPLKPSAPPEPGENPDGVPAETLQEAIL